MLKLFQRPPAPTTPRRPLRVLGSGAYLPGAPVPSEVLDRRLGLEAGTLERLSGVRQRHISQGEHAAQMGAKAARAALDDAGLSLKDMDLLLCVSGSPDQIVPSNASLMLAELDPQDSGLPCFDINSTCLSFVVGLDTISYAMAAGRYRRVLLVAAELPSLGLNPKELESYSLFGDGAVAVVVEAGQAGSRPGILASGQESYASGVAQCQIYGGAGRLPAYRYAQEDPDRFLFHMDGRGVFKLASKVLPTFVERLMGQAGLRLGDIDTVIPHQASGAAMEILTRKFGFTEGQLVRILPDHGNNIAASIPLALHTARKSGRLEPGMRALLLGTSAGFSVGGLVLEA